MKQFPLLVFDWDGTLVDSIDRIVSSLQYASREAVGIDVSEQQARDVIGLGLREAIARLHPELAEAGNAADQSADPVLIEKIAEAYRQHYLFENTVPAPLFAGVRELLEELRAEGYQLAVSTGKSRRGLEQSLTEHDMTGYFSDIRCASDHQSKPHPEMLHKILQKLNFSADKTLMIGDSEHDMKMANNAGIACIGVTHGVHSSDILQQFKPLACLDDITDLSRYLSHNH
ncbi:MAG TPA: HAD-IIIA family hydrolase [Gammaproteobacteria bacterium]|nr:HAD-IIIA family hydrolase [Gammaproteobacteria bacterium]